MGRAGVGNAVKYSGSREGWGYSTAWGDPGWGGEIPATPAGTAPHSLGPFIGVYVVGQTQGIGCPDS